MAARFARCIILPVSPTYALRNTGLAHHRLAWARTALPRQLAQPAHHLPPPRPCRLAPPPQAVARHHLDHQVTRRFSHTGEVLYSSDNGSLTAAISERGELISLPWHVLQRELAAALPPGVLRTSHRFVRFAETADGVEAEFETADGGTITVEAGLLIGCDGSQSPVRQQLFGDGPPTFLREWEGRASLPAIAEALRLLVLS